MSEQNLNSTNAQNPSVDARNENPWALITGASAGLGAEFARQLAAQNYNLILTARRSDRLEELARELSSKYAIAIHLLPGDLARVSEPQRIFDVLERENIILEFLVNNAGFGMPGTFDEHKWIEHQEYVQLMLSAPLEMSHRALRMMHARKRGFIINVSSLAGFMPGTQAHTLYAASKSFLIKFSQSLSQESARFQVNVCALCPGFTYTEFHDANGTREKMNKLPKFVWMDAESVVRQGLEAVKRGDPVYINGKWNQLLAFLSRALPQTLIYWLMQRQQHKFRKLDP